MGNGAAGMCLVVGLLGACTAEPARVELDGPVAYNTYGFPGSWTALQVAVDGSASLHIAIEAGRPRDFTGNASSAALAALRDDIAAADVGSLASEYTCPDPRCDAPEPRRTLVVEVAGTSTQISVDSQVSNAQLPAGLAKVFQDLEAMSVQLSSSTGS